MRTHKLKEDGGMPAPTMSAGSGQVAGIGVGPEGEPGVKLPRKRRREMDEETNLWKYNKRSGYWDHQRTIASPKDEQTWLNMFQQDEPGEHFVLSRIRPSKKPKLQETSLSDVAMTIAHERDLTSEDLRDWFGKGKEGGVGGGGWDRYNTKGERIGKCGDAEDRGGEGEGKPKCLSKEKAAQLRAQGGKQAIANAVKRKKAQDPVTNRRGTGNTPRPVSNRIGESILAEKNVPTNPSLWSRAKAEAKKRFDVYPCVPLDSLAITKSGPTSHDDIEIGDEILTYNMEKDCLEWKPVQHKHYYENAPLIEIGKPTGFSIRCTPNHKWVVDTKTERKLVEAQNLTTHMNIVMCASLHNESTLLLCDWSKHERWVDHVLSMDKNQREIFLASSIVYDGWDKGLSSRIHKRHTFGFSQKKYDHLWSSLLAAYLNGYYVSFRETPGSVSGATYIRNKRTHGTQNLYKKEAGTDSVWCPTTENETWVMIQNGLITITGNSAYANGWAAKWYKKRGGGWKSEKNEAYDLSDPSQREWGTDSLVRIYKQDTPGELAEATALVELLSLGEAWERITTCQQCKKKLSPREQKLGFRICDACVKKNKGKMWGKDSDDDYVDEDCGIASLSEHETSLIEGVDDPGVLKCVFMAGGPGSGKSYVAGELFAVTPRFRASFSTHGLKLVNSDATFENELRKHGINPKDLATLIHNTDKWNQIMALRDRAKALTALQQRLYESGRLGLIIDGTGDDVHKIQTKVQQAQSLGYDCYMVFVNTSLETALARNAARPRVLPASIVKDSWTDVQKNMGAFQRLFGTARFLIVDNNKESQSLELMNKQIRAWMNAPVTNPIGKAWQALAHRLRRSNVDPRSENPALHEDDTCTSCGNLREDDTCTSCGEARSLEEAEYDGRTVTLNNPFRTPDGPKKFAVYVKNENGNVIKLGFGDPNLSIKRDDPERRKNFLARHNCSDPGPKWKAKYWSCKWGWGKKSISDKLKEETS